MVHPPQLSSAACDPERRSDSDRNESPRGLFTSSQYRIRHDESFVSSPSHDYEIGEVCGSGSFSVVRQVRRVSDGKIFACKMTDSCGGGDCHRDTKPYATFRRAIQEVEIMNVIGHHQSISSCYDAFITDFRVRGDVRQTPKLCLVTDLMRGSDLCTVLAQLRTFPEEDTRAVMRQLLCAVEHVHNCGVVHRDIKLENILVTSELNHTEIKLSDFGLAAAGCGMEPHQACLTERCGTPLYVAPEVIKRDALYGHKVDLWSCGVVMFILLAGYPPFFGTDGDLNKTLASIASEEINFCHTIWNVSISSEARDLVQRLLTKDPEQRLSAHEALRHPWLR